MYEVRNPLYIDASDAVIPITHKNPPQIAAEEVLRIFTELI